VQFAYPPNHKINRSAFFAFWYRLSAGRRRRSYGPPLGAKPSPRWSSGLSRSWRRPTTTWTCPTCDTTVYTADEHALQDTRWACDRADLDRTRLTAERLRSPRFVRGGTRRRGEAIALTVADVEFLKRRISVHRNAVQVGQDFEVGQTKGKENRTVPIAASVLSRLAARCEGRLATDLLSPARGGGYLKRPSYDSTGWFNRAVERARVQTITPHDLRHSCASLSVSSGANVLAVSRMLGHKDPSVTLRIYADLFDSDLDAVAINLDAKIADSVQSVSKAPADRRPKRSKTAV
jgi:Phage integrase family